MKIIKTLKFNKIKFMANLKYLIAQNTKKNMQWLENDIKIFFNFRWLFSNYPNIKQKIMNNLYKFYLFKKTQNSYI